MNQSENDSVARGSWDAPADIAIVTTAEVINGELPVLVIIHDKDIGDNIGSWQFLDGEPMESREAVSISKEDLLNLDPTLAEITDLPAGWYAEREQPGAPWQRAELQEDPTPTDEPLSPEADAFIIAACEEYEEKQAAIHEQWKFDQIKEWQCDDEKGLIFLSLEDGSRLQARAQLVGSYSEADQSWEWAWNDASIDKRMAKQSHVIRELGERFALDFLRQSPLPISTDRIEEGYLGYLLAIALKATGSDGIFDTGLDDWNLFYTITDVKQVE